MPTSNKLILYFHGNAEDLALSHQQAERVAEYLNINVLVVEYPNYGIYDNNGEACETKIKEDAEYVYRYCI